ncbi:MAG: hypothetical protein RSD82_07590 [Comamonas sp.]
MAFAGGSALSLTGCGGGSSSDEVPTPLPVVRDAGIYLLAGQLGGGGLLAGVGAEARLPSNNWSLSISPDGTIYAPTGSSFAKITQDAQVSYELSPIHQSELKFVKDAFGQLYAFAWNCIYRQNGATWALVAGNPEEMGYQDGPAAAARFGFLYSPVLGADGSIYFIDKGGVLGEWESITIRRLTAAGQVQTVAGQQGVLPVWRDGQGSAAGFGDLRQLLAQADGTLMAFDNGYFRRVTLDGQVSSISNPDNYESRVLVHSLVQASATSFYALEDSRVVHVTLEGVITPVAGIREENLDVWSVQDGVGDAVRFQRPRALIGLPGGDLLVGESSAALRRVNPRTREVSSWVGANNVHTLVDGAGSEARFNGNVDAIAVNAQGAVYVLDFDSKTEAGAQVTQQLVRKITPNGQVTTLAGKLPLGLQQFIADTNDNLYYAEGSAIIQLRPDGTLVQYAGDRNEKGFADGPATKARFAVPRGLCFDHLGNLWVLDTPFFEYEKPTGAVITGGKKLLRVWYGQTIRCISPGGEVTTFFGNAGQVLEPPFTGLQAWWQLWNDISVDTSGRVYFYSLRAGVYRIDHKTAEPIKIWGDDNSTNSGGTEKITIAPSGQIFVTSTLYDFQGGGSVIHAVGPDGALRVVAGQQGPHQLGIRLGALPGVLNYVFALHAFDDKTLIVSSERSILQVVI